MILAKTLKFFRLLCLSKVFADVLRRKKKNLSRLLEHLSMKNAKFVFFPKG